MKRIVVLLCVFILCCSVFGCAKSEKDGTKKIDASGLTEVTIFIYPPTFKKKVIHKRKDIKKVIQYLNAIEKKETKNGGISGGFTVTIRDKDGLELAVVGMAAPYMTVYGEWYEIPEDEDEKLLELYESLDYEEEEW